MVRCALTNCFSAYVNFNFPWTPPYTQILGFQKKIKKDINTEWFLKCGENGNTLNIYNHFPELLPQYSFCIFTNLTLKTSTLKVSIITDQVKPMRLQYFSNIPPHIN